MSHASVTHDIFARVEAAEARLAEIREQEAQAADALKRAQAEAEMALLLADVAAVWIISTVQNFEGFDD